MRRVSIILLAACALVAAFTFIGCELPNFAPGLGPARTARDRMEQATLRIADGNSVCAGVLMPYQLGLTAHHCLRDARPGAGVTAQFRDGTLVRAQVLKADASLDIAVLAVPAAHARPTLSWPRAGSIVAAGVPVLVAGHPLGTRGASWCVALGSAEGEMRIDAVPVPVMAVNVVVWGGNSGGPVATLDGHLTGIMLRRDDDHRRGYALPVQSIREFVEGAVGSAPTTNVILYTARWCGACVAARGYLRLRRIPFEERDADAPAVWQALVAWAAQRGVRVEGVPVIVIGDSIITGFNKAALDQALRNAGILR